MGILYASFSKHDLLASIPSKKATLFPLLLISIFPFSYRQLIYPESVKGLWLLFILQIIIVLLVLTYFGLRDKYGEFFTAFRFKFLILVAIAMRVSVIFISPNPFIDVWVTQQEAVDVLVGGGDPYNVLYTQIYNRDLLEILGYEPLFYYPPLSLWFVTPFKIILGDIRFGYVICELLSLLIFRLICFTNKGLAHDDRVELIYLLWALNPVSLFVLEQAWTEPLMVMLFALFFYLWLKKRPILAAVSLGLLCSSKQYAIAFVFLTVFLNGWQNLLLPLLVAIVFPYIITFPISTTNMFRNMLLVLKYPPRADSMSFATVIRGNIGKIPALVSNIAAPLFSYIVLLFKSKKGLVHFSTASTVVFTLIFWTSKQAFCNYYYFLSAIIFTTFLMRLNNKLNLNI